MLKKLLTFFILAVLAGCASVAPRTDALIPKYVVEQDSSYLRLYEAPCSVAQVAAVVAPETLAKLRHLDSRFPVVNRQTGERTLREFKGCWMEEGGIVHMIFEDGDYITLPLTEFTQPKGARES